MPPRPEKRSRTIFSSGFRQLTDSLHVRPQPSSCTGSLALYFKCYSSILFGYESLFYKSLHFSRLGSPSGYVSWPISLPCHTSLLHSHLIDVPNLGPRSPTDAQMLPSMGSTSHLSRHVFFPSTRRLLVVSSRYHAFLQAFLTTPPSSCLIAPAYPIFPLSTSCLRTHSPYSNQDRSRSQRITRARPLSTCPALRIRDL